MLIWNCSARSELKDHTKTINASLTMWTIVMRIDRIETLLTDFTAMEVRARSETWIR